MKSSFLQRIAKDLLQQKKDLSEFTIVFPGKRPEIFFKKALLEAGYTGFLPEFYTIEQLIEKVSQTRKIEGISLWLEAYQIYNSVYEEDLNSFLKWFPTLKKDWDDVLKFQADEKQLLSYMAEEERIKNWSESLGDPTELQKKHLDFWRKQSVFLPLLRNKLEEKNYATLGMLYEKAAQNTEIFILSTDQHFVFCGFNALTPVEETIIRKLLQWNKAQVFFDADAYYINDTRQEAGAYLRKFLKWKEFGDHRRFNWISDEFKNEKDIQVLEVPGSITQTRVLPELLVGRSEKELENTAVILLDESLLPPTIQQLSFITSLNITMGYPIDNLKFSSAIRSLFHLQKQLEKNAKSYYYKDVVAFLSQVPANKSDLEIIEKFNSELLSSNLVYLSLAKLEKLLEGLSFFELLIRPVDPKEYISKLIEVIREFKTFVSDDLIYENISHFEKAFVILLNQITFSKVEVTMQTLEVLLSQMIQNEEIQFIGEPLEGLQVMGLLETRLLDFDHIILLSTNEGKLPQGPTHNSYLPFDVRSEFHLPTYVQNDSIFAYHFYRLLQHAEKVDLVYNSVGSGLSTGEMSRFIHQLERESPHELKKRVVDTQVLPVEESRLQIEKTDIVKQKLELWKTKASPSHLISYLYNPIEFYNKTVLGLYVEDDIEEELSIKNYGILVHRALQTLYEPLVGKTLNAKDLSDLLPKVNKAIREAIVHIKHQPEAYERGMNYVHKTLAVYAVEGVIQHDLRSVEKGNSLEILGIEKKFTDIPFLLDPSTGETLYFKGIIDRIDRVNGLLRVIDYKSGKTDALILNFSNTLEPLVLTKEHKQSLQLALYMHFMNEQKEIPVGELQAGIWSFLKPKQGPSFLEFKEGTLEEAKDSIRGLINEILDPSQPFLEPEPPSFKAK